MTFLACTVIELEGTVQLEIVVGIAEAAVAVGVVSEEAGFANVRTMQRRFQDALGMTPVEYRLMTTRDL